MLITLTFARVKPNASKMNMKLIWGMVMLLTLMLFSACDQQTDNVAKEFVSVKGQRFIDSQGRQLILHGINVVNKDPETGYLGHVGPGDFAKFKSWGFNVIRLGIIWDGLEPEPGEYNEEYLKGIDEMIQWAADHDLYVFLDMHQDLYSVKFSDGAPEWATITDGQPHQTGEIWSDAYLISPAVQTAFDNFWKNTPAPDSIGIQDHYINLWKHIAKRYADNMTVIGFDIMNEPFMGSEANKVMPLLIQAFAKVLVEKTGQAPPPGEELMMMWSIPEERLKVLEMISEKEVYKSVIDGIYEVNAAFEKGPLTAFFQKARDAIREVDENHIIFIEHSYFTNMGVKGALQSLVDENGNQDLLVAYAAHGYDLVVDTEGIANPSMDRTELIFERIAESGRRMNMPVLIGEWGAFGGVSPEYTPVAAYIMNLFNKFLFSDTYWAYGKHMEGAPYVTEVLAKPYPVKTSGMFESYNYDFESGQFECQWLESGSIKSPTVIYVPDLERLSKEGLKIIPEANKIDILNIEGSTAGYLIIPSLGRDANRSVSFTIELGSNEEISLVKQMRRN